MKKTRAFFYGWIIVFASFLVVFMVTGVRQTFTVYLIPISTEFGWDRTLVSSASSISILASAALLPFIGKIIARYGPKRLMLISAPILGLSTILLSRISSPLEYYLLHMLGGIVYSCIGVLPVTVLLGRWFHKKRGTAMGIALSGFPFSRIVLVPLLTYLISTYGWRTSYLIFGALFLVTVLPLFLILKDDPEELGLEIYGGPPSNQKRDNFTTNEREVTILEVMKTRSFLLLMIAYFFCGFDIPVYTHFAAFVQDIGFSGLTVASVLSLMGVSDLLGTIFLGPISDRLGRKNILASMWALRTFSLLPILGTPGVTRLYAFAVPFGVTYFGMSSVVSAWITDNYGVKSLGKLMGVIILLHFISTSFGTFLLGFIFDTYQSYYWGFFLVVIFSAIASLTAFLMKDKVALV